MNALAKAFVAVSAIGMASCLMRDVTASGTGARPRAHKAYQANVAALAQENTSYRHVLYTGVRSQLVLMTIPPGGDIGEETHGRVEQTLFIVSGSGRASLDGVDSATSAGDVVVVTPGVKHNLTNVGKDPLKLYTIYAPPNHLDGLVEATKADAEADKADEEFGHEVETGTR